MKYIIEILFFITILYFYCFNIINNYYSLINYNYNYNDNTLSFISYSIGYSYSCWINNNYKMKCFGYNLYKQLGLNDAQNKGDNINEMSSNLDYVNPGTIDNAKFKLVYCGLLHTCSILTNNKSKCWGYNLDGQLGIGSSDTDSIGNTGDTLPFIDFGNIDNIDIIPISFVIGAQHTCTLFNNKKIKCFGQASNGALGYENQNSIGSDPSHMGNNLPFVNLGTNILISSIHSSGYSDFNCIIIDILQEIKCWGNNEFSQLGYNDFNTRGKNLNTMGDNLPIINLGTNSKVLQVSVGTYHTCVIRIDNELLCWGNNINGRLGIGTMTSPISTSSPEFMIVEVDSTIKMKAIYVSAGYDHTCIILNNNISAKCIGSNGSGQLGQGDQVSKGNSPSNTMDQSYPINLENGNLKILSINSGYEYTCVVFEDSTVKCFGNGQNGRLGSGSTSNIGISPSQMGKNLKSVNIFETTSAPTKNPIVPTNSPTKNPSKSPTKSPTKKPTLNPTNDPTKSPSLSPTMNPSKNPTKNPSNNPARNPTLNPTKSPILGCQYTNQKKCKKDNKCMWRKDGEGGECTVIDCTAFEKKKCKSNKEICDWKKKSCFQRE